MSCPACPDCQNLHLKPCSDYGKITENSFPSGILFCRFASRRHRKESAMQGIIAFRGSISGIFETQMQKSSVLSSTCRIIFP